METLLKLVAEAIQTDQDILERDGWHIERFYGGMNGIIYRAENSTTSQPPLTVKVRKRDGRQRAAREFYALQALYEPAAPVTPQAIGLYPDRHDLPGDVVVATWVDGPVLGDLSEADETLWEKILATLVHIHQTQPGDVPQIQDAVIPVRGPRDVVDNIRARFEHLPDGQLGAVSKAEIGRYVEQSCAEALEADQLAPQLSLIVCDAGPSNMIKRDGRIVIVDWENSGWGDPAFDLADLLVRPECAAVTAIQRQTRAARYAALMGLPELASRVLVYERLMRVFWLIITTRGLAGDQPRYKGTRSFTREQTIAQQIAYVQRIQATR